MTTVVVTGPVLTHDDFGEAGELIYFGLDKTTLLTTGNHISCYLVSVPPCGGYYAAHTSPGKVIQK
jgi:hypothetical protein